MKVILAVIGSREMKDHALFEREMSKWVAEYGAPDEIVSGGARGADTLGARYAREKGIILAVFRPDYNRYPGHIAPLMRNTQIIEYCTHILAFPSRAGRGTQDSLRKAGSRPAQVVFID